MILVNFMGLFWLMATKLLNGLFHPNLVFSAQHNVSFTKIFMMNNFAFHHFCMGVLVEEFPQASYINLFGPQDNLQHNMPFTKKSLNYGQ